MATKVIRFQAAPTMQQLADLRATGCEIVHVSTLAPEVTVQLPDDEPGQVRALASRILALSGVAALEDDFTVGVVLRDVHPLVRVTELWAAAPRQGAARPGSLAATVQVEPLYQGQGITVAILDTGIDAAYPDFAGRITRQRDYTGEGDGDGHGHGTHVASIVGASGAADRYVGMAPQCQYLIYKVLGRSGAGSAATIAQAVEQALADGADVINMSLGGEATSGEPDFLQRRVDLVGARVPVIVASGNSGPKGAKPYRESPGRAANAITVGATEKDDDVASFTSRGVTDDERVKPNVYAPGHQIAAARAAGTTMGTPLSKWTVVASGTSMATPCLAGLVACLLSYDPALKGQPQQVKAIVMHRGVGIGAEGPRVVAPQLVVRPYPEASLGVDRRAEPTPEPAPSECEGLLETMLADPVLRRTVIRRLVPAARREFRRALARR